MSAQSEITFTLRHYIDLSGVKWEIFSYNWPCYSTENGFINTALSTSVKYCTPYCFWTAYLDIVYWGRSNAFFFCMRGWRAMVLLGGPPSTWAHSVGVSYPSEGAGPQTGCSWGNAAVEHAEWIHLYCHPFHSRTLGSIRDHVHSILCTRVKSV